MARRFQVFQHRQLIAKNGDCVAGGGDSVAADHPAVLALVDPHSVGRFFEHPVPPASLEYMPPKQVPLGDPDDAHAPKDKSSD